MPPSLPRIYLASRSSRRRELLKQRQDVMLSPLLLERLGPVGALGARAFSICTSSEFGDQVSKT